MQTWLCVRVGRTAVHQPVSIGGAKISSVGLFYIMRLTALVHGSGLTASRIQVSLLPLTQT